MNAIPLNKMYKNEVSLVGDKFMPEMHLKQPGFTCSACSPFTENKERIENFMQTGHTDFIYRNRLDKACFEHDTAYGKSEDLVKSTQSDRVYKDKAFKIAINPKYDGYQRRLASTLYKFFDKSLKEVELVNQIIIDITRDYYIESNGTAFNGTASNKDSIELHSIHSNKKKLVIMLEFPNKKHFC